MGDTCCICKRPATSIFKIQMDVEMTSGSEFEVTFGYPVCPQCLGNVKTEATGKAERFRSYMEKQGAKCTRFQLMLAELSEEEQCESV